MGDRTPVLVIVHFRLREASQRTTLEEDEDACPGSEAVALPLAPFARGGKSFATHRSPCGDGVSR